MQYHSEVLGVEVLNKGKDIDIGLLHSFLWPSKFIFFSHVKSIHLITTTTKLNLLQQQVWVQNHF